MLDEETIQSTYREIEENAYLDDWQLNCLRAVCRQSITAIKLQKELDFVRKFIINNDMQWALLHEYDKLKARGE